MKILQFENHKNKVIFTKANEIVLATEEVSESRTLWDLQYEALEDYISQIDGERVKQFLTIISKIQVESKSSSKKLERILIEKSEEIKEMRISFKEEMGELREELKETREKLDISLKREVDLLRELLNERK